MALNAQNFPLSLKNPFPYMSVLECCDSFLYLGPVFKQAGCYKNLNFNCYYCPFPSLFKLMSSCYCYYFIFELLCLEGVSGEPKCSP